MKNEMNSMSDVELQDIQGGSVSNDAVYGAGIGVAVFALGILFVATAPLSATGVVVVGLLGVAGDAAAIWAASN